jgi:ABC-type multidrug transport system fused ATPase/permease subunit
MDPLQLSSDDAIISVLEKVRICDVLPAEGLDVKMEKVPFSHGQKQLFCLARALLHRQKIVVLDEVSSRYVTFSP